MLIKFYLFVRDFIPRGLTGSFSHIKGQDVMDYLLCHSEHTISRHKVTKAADTGFSELERWMGTSDNWQSALQCAKDAESNERGRRKFGWKASGLHSPAGLMAVLIIAHPDPDQRFKHWIGRLQIGWMMTQSRDTLAVEGFWKGLNSANLYTVFATEEARRPEFRMLASYTPLFRDFLSCRRDIRPYLQPWCQDIALEEEPSEIESDIAEDNAADDGAVALGVSGIRSQHNEREGAQAGGHQHSIDRSPSLDHANDSTPAVLDESSLRGHLNPPTTKTIGELEA